tara:strand:+ start:681 stop:1058 length:378 start_codon:yes stop_codon:yes gene_type:complete
LSDEQKETIDVNSAISILAQEMAKIKEELHQRKTANLPEPQPAPQDAFHAPLTLKTLLDELPNILNMARQTGIISSPPQDPLINYKVAIGEKALERVFDDLNKTLFNKAERQGVNDLINNNSGIQ